MKTPLLLLLLLSLPVNAQIYRWVDENGNVVFSDEPSPQAEEVKLPPSATYTPVEVPEAEQTTDESADTEVASGYQLRIVSPANDESIWANNGNLAVTVVVEPALDIERGDRMLFELDGAAVGEPLTSTSVQLTNLDRGTHNLRASVVDSNGSVLSSSDAIVFHLHRTSILNQPKQN